MMYKSMYIIYYSLKEDNEWTGPGAQVVEGQVNFWVLLQLFRAMRRKRDEEKERRLLAASEEAKFNSQEVSQFQEAQRT